MYDKTGELYDRSTSFTSTGLRQRNDEPDEFEIDAFVRNDTALDKTFSRRIVENVLCKCKWYNPNVDREGVDLKKGWAFYEHYTLPRRIYECNGDNKMHISRATMQVEAKTSLYGIFDTPSSALPEWGIGVALYFRAIIVMGVALLIAGLISIPNIIFFSSAEYHGDGFNLDPKLFLLRGSAVCENFEWVPCEKVGEDSKFWCNEELMKKRNITWQDSDDGTTTFVKKSLCDGAKLSTGMCNYAAVMFLIIITIIYPYYTRKKSAQVDEDCLTASDYSVHIKNPPDDAYDPTEWREFFMQYAEKNVVACAVILDNNKLLSNLINRRVCRNELQRLLPGEDIDDKETFYVALKDHIEERDRTKWTCCCILKPILQPFNKLLPAEKLVEKIKMYTQNAIELREEKYKVTDVIITFESEISQRNALKALRVAKRSIRQQKTEGTEKKALFRDEILLDVDRPVEPGAIRYREMSSSGMVNTTRMIITFIIVVGLVVLGIYIVIFARKGGSLSGGIATSLLNLTIPLIVRLLLLLEKHSAEGNRQKSLYIKITLFRWFLTVFNLQLLIIPMTAKTLGHEESDDLLRLILGIFISEIILIPLIRFIDIPGTISKHYFAPRATTQHQMYLSFKGTPYYLAERYTDMTKIVLLSYFYCALYPVTLFLGSLTLLIRYYSDKFSLIRVWRSAPLIGDQVTEFSSRYVFTLAAVLSAFASASNWVHFSFDHVCDGNSTVPAQGFNVTLTFPDARTQNVNVTAGSSARVCSADTCCQDLSLDILTLWKQSPMLDEKNNSLTWVSDDQRSLALIYGATVFCIILSYLIYLFSRTARNIFLSKQSKGYDPHTEVQNKNFSSLENIPGYIPQVADGRFSFPLLLCDVDDIDPGMIGWNDPDRPYRDHSLVFDIPNHRLETANSMDTCATKQSIASDSKSDAPIFHFVKKWDNE